MRTIKRHEGMSLVEATIILLVLMLLTAVLAPSIFDYVQDARMVKVKEDCEAIGISIARLVRDSGNCLMINATNGLVNGADPGCVQNNRVSLLVSNGTRASAANVAHWHAIDNTATPEINWDTTDSFAANDVHRVDTFENQLVTNVPVYSTVGTTAGGNFNNNSPNFGLGWRGAYLASPIGPDPWGSAYEANVHFLAVVSDSIVGLPNPARQEGARNGGWDHDVFCISAGANQAFNTLFADDANNRGTTRRFDDFVYIIQGATR